jgi:hypothetical protein
MGPLIQTPLPLLAATIGLSGVLFLLLGIIAEVQVCIYFEARGRPPTRSGRWCSILPRRCSVLAVVAADRPTGWNARHSPV